MPVSLCSGERVAALDAYVRIDRALVVEEAREAGRYARIRRPLVIEDPARPLAREVGRAGRGIELRKLDLQERRRTLVVTPDGLEPAALWLTETGTPMALSTWKGVFSTANRRCRTKGLEPHCHAHLLCHSFAVITLEQLQRGHLAELAGLTAGQRGHYRRVFGDPLDWVRRRLGHRSVLTTMIYLHALQELEMESRMLLVPDGWEDPRETGLGQIGDDGDLEAAAKITVLPTRTSRAGRSPHPAG